ncbi:MAG: thiamine-monophosphate kinase [Pseudohongiellaceae bacterium]|jgi:thiamine-monophosphate kinase
MSLSEFDTISHYFNSARLGFSRSGVSVGIGDDGAVIQPPQGSSLSMSMDLLVEGVHFPQKANSNSIANRALAVNLSDLSAMAATPLCFTLGLSLPSLNEDWLEGFSEGFSKIARRFNCPLVGGDLTQSPVDAPIVIAIQVHGYHLENPPILRSTALNGDGIFVTGTLGDGAIGLCSLGLQSHLENSIALDLAALNQDHRAYLNQAYYEPEPRIEFALAAAGLMTACIDISDGLAGDLGHILKSSGVGGDVTSTLIPYSSAAMANVSLEGRLQAALYGGDDYELCFTAPKHVEEQLYRIAASQNIGLQKIGEITSGCGLRLLDERGAEILQPNQAYQHFAPSVSSK